jgi:hypothetical protein
MAINYCTRGPSGPEDQRILANTLHALSEIKYDINPQFNSSFLDDLLDPSNQAETGAFRVGVAVMCPKNSL